MAAPTKAEVQALLKKDNRSVVGTKDPQTAGKVGVFYGLGPDGVDYGQGPIAKADPDDDSAWLAGGDLGQDAGADEVILVPLVGTEASGALGPNDIRTQNFFPQGAKQGQVLAYDATKPGFGAKQVYVNQYGEALDKTGAPATKSDLSDAADPNKATPEFIPVGPITTAMKLNDAAKVGNKYWTQATDSRGANKWLGPVTNWAQTNRSVLDDGTDKAYESTARTPVPGSYQANERQTSLYAPYVGWTAQD